MDEREFELINILGGDLGVNQRELSRQMDTSLGMVNMLIRRLISKGYIRIEQLNKRKVQYILTPKGFAEKMRKSIKYTLKTINSFSLIKDRFKEILTELHQSGHKKFYVYSESDLSTIILKAYYEANLSDASIEILEQLPDSELGGMLLIGYENVDLKGFNESNHMDLIMEVAKEGSLVKL